MLSMTSTVVGGVGLFLLGMILMTDGLKALAGDALRSLLSRFTGGPLSALLSGTAVTAVVQSSSATTLMTIGFVSAGLMTFGQAVGVVFGANLGTTSTGWLVSMLGLKLSVGKIALPLIGVGALSKLLGRGKVAHAGMALCGFGVIFVGIDVLQAGMAALSSKFDPSSFPDNTLTGRILLVLIGIAMTVVMQSSIAAVATTLAALHSGTIDLDQAAAMVIGQNVGTTVTAALAGIGASVAAKRTALAHILFNTITGALAFAVLPLFTRAVDGLADRFGGGDDAVSIAAFHTAFNLLGVAVFLPVMGRFARLIERMIPEKAARLARHLDSSMVDLPGIAVEASRRALMEISSELVRDAGCLMADRRHEPALEECEDALLRTRQFMAKVGRLEASGKEYRLHVSNLHATDHADRLLAALREATPRRADSRDPRLLPFRELAVRAAAGASWLGDPARKPDPGTPKAASIALADLRRAERPRLLEETAAGACDSEQALALLEGMHWFDRVAYHIWRISEHLAGQPPPAGQPESAPDPG